jgi:cell cycle checkpoint control protein RAD9A
MEAVLDVRFTDPAAALYVDVLSDGIEGLFAMSTSRVPGAPAPPPSAVPSQARSAGSSGSAEGRARKRPREEDVGSRHRTPAKVVERVEPARVARQGSRARVPTSSQRASTSAARMQPHPTHEEPLFLPGTQMSAADQAALHASGFRDMDVDEFNAMMEDEGVEVGLNLGPSDSRPPSPGPAPDLDLEEQGHGQNVDWFEDDDIESTMGPTQSDESGRVRLPFHFRVRGRFSDRFLCGSSAVFQAFQPLFND